MNTCKQCNTEIRAGKHTKRRKFCSQKCAHDSRKKVRSLCSECKTVRVKSARAKFCSYLCSVRHIESTDFTKGELFKNRKNWQSARSTIQKNARLVYFALNEKPACEVCGYVNHVEVAHRKSVSSFDASCALSEINDIANLIGLCPNHHWEFDNGMLAPRGSKTLRQLGRV